VDPRTATLAGSFLLLGLLFLIAGVAMAWIMAGRVRGPKGEAGPPGPPGPSGPVPGVDAVRVVVQNVLSDLAPVRSMSMNGPRHFSMPLSEEGRRAMEREQAAQSLRIETPSCAEILMSRSLLRAIRHRLKGIGENQPGQTYDEVLVELASMVADITGFLDADLRIQLPPLWVAGVDADTNEVIGIFSDPEKARQNCEPFQGGFYGPLFLDEARETESHWPGRINVTPLQQRPPEVDLPIHADYIQRCSEAMEEARKRSQRKSAHLRYSTALRVALLDRGLTLHTGPMEMFAGSVYPHGGPMQAPPACPMGSWPDHPDDWSLDTYIVWIGDTGIAPKAGEENPTKL